MVKLRNGLVTLAVLAAMGLPASAQELKWKFRTNDKFYQETTATMKQTVTVAGQTQNQDLEQVAICSFKIKTGQPESTNVVLEQTIDSVRISGSAPLGAAQKAMESMQGTTFTITLGRNNDVTTFEGYDEFLKKVGADDPLVGRMIRTTMSQETLKKAIEESFAFLGSETRKPGSTWKRESAMSLGPLGTIKSEYTYSYVGSETRNNKLLAKIAVVTKLTYQAPQGEAASGLGFQITKGQLKCENAKGTLWFDIDAGRLAESEMKMQLKGNLTVSANGQDFAMDLDQEQSVRVRLTTEPPLPATK